MLMWFIFFLFLTVVISLILILAVHCGISKHDTEAYLEAG